MSSPNTKRAANDAPNSGGSATKKQKQREKGEAGGGIEEGEGGEIPHVEIRAPYDNTSADVVKGLAEAFQGSKSFKDEVTGSYVVGSPFPACVIENLFDDKFLGLVKDALEESDWFKKSNDLYEFLQSEDLKLSKAPHVAALRTALYSPAFRQLMTTITGIEFNGTPDLSSHRYPPNGYLACHDDDIEDDDGTGRRVAFILYLVPEGWSYEHGGRLELFDQDKDGQPSKITERIVPKFGRFAFFETTPTSYHQVQENLANLDRWSISGWFHGPRPKIEPPKTPPSILPAAEPLNEQCTTELADWINPDYLTPTLAEQLSDQFVDASEAELRRFLTPEKYAAVAKQLEEAEWTDVGPANRRNYSTTPDPRSTSPDSPLSQLLNLLTSTKFTSYLTTLTNLDLQSVSLEIRQLEKGSYTLLSDYDPPQPPTLDVHLTFFSQPDQSWPEEWGGELHYLADTDDLLVVFPWDNALSLVYREEGVVRFTKMVNHRAEFERREIVLSFVEKEREGGDDDEEDEDGDGEEDGEAEDGDEEVDGESEGDELDEDDVVFLEDEE